MTMRREGMKAMSFAIKSALLPLAVALPIALEAGGGLSASSNKPGINTFITGERPEISFSAEGLKQEAKLSVEVVDEFDGIVERKEMDAAPDASGKVKFSYQAPASKLGFYKVKAKLSNGATIAAEGSRPEGFISYCVVPDPAKREELSQDDAFFFAITQTSIDTTNYLGGRWTHTGWGYYAWKFCEPNRSGEFSELRAKAKAAGKDFPEKMGIDHLTVAVDGKKTPWRTYQVPWLFNPPDWAIEKGSRAYTTGILTPDGEKAWVEYCKQAAKAYAEDHPDESVHVYQITWEPHYPWGFKGTEEQLIRIYELAYPVLHEIDPKALVAGPTGSHFLNVWHESLLKKGLAKYIDAFSIHPYCDIPGERNGIIPLARQLKEIIRKECGRDLPIYGTEQGSISTAEKGGELGQAQGVIREHLIMLGEGFKANVPFLAFDGGKEEPYGYYYNLDPKVSFSTKSLQPKPAAPAFAALTWLLDGYKSAGAIDWLGECSLGYVYERKGDVRLALWDFGDAPRKVSLPIGVDKATVCDWMGNSKEMATEKGFLTIELSKEPLYVLGVSTKLWGSKAERILSVASSKVDVFPGEKAIVSGVVKAPSSRPLAATLSFAPDAAFGQASSTKDFNLATGEEGKFSFEIPVAASLKPGALSASLALSDKEGRILAGGGAAVEVKAPVSVEAILPEVSADGASKRIVVKIKDEKGCGAEGKLSGSLDGVPESSSSCQFSVPPGKTATAALDFGKADCAPQRRYDAKIEIATSSGFSVKESLKANFMAAPKLTAPPSLDGSGRGWEKAPAIELAGREYVLRSPQYYKGESDLSAKIQYAWDDASLYFRCVVKDDAFVQEHSGWETWDGDSVQLDFDLDPFQKEKLSGNTLADKDSAKRFTQIDIALAKDGPEAFRTIPCERKSLAIGPLGPKEISLHIERDEASRTTGYEAAIPWSSLGADKAPERIGVAAEINDRDEPTGKPRIDVKGLCLFEIHKTSKHGVLCLAKPEAK